ncbi:helix-turn-helix domain-containing protein [Enterococcus sp. CWB-B31]|uniref:helix-turn-helix domain-containing protein n=1 Tax=Enterococcus sp. CWB-B31 TaxID=2885159 RepID=UPI001E2A2029|nr:helix-turn-helix transcriptional regulator [Enterococcus sp. CWB-B31]MCB5954264.1 helix-turn-helix domain-containing protein [Enterococcus sp. CWB-B31]
MNPEIQTFAENLKLIRKERKLSQTQLAEKIGLTKQSIINYEKGNTFPTGNRLAKLLEALEITPEQLLGTENVQMESEKDLLAAVENEAFYLAGYDITIEYSLEDLHSYLLDVLSHFSTSQLHQAILYLHEKEILEKTTVHSKKLAQNIVDSTESNHQSVPDMDIILNHFDE